jgi:hypothetical protein
MTTVEDLFAFSWVSKGLLVTLPGICPGPRLLEQMMQQYNKGTQTATNRRMFVWG